MHPRQPSTVFRRQGRVKRLPTEVPTGILGDLSSSQCAGDQTRSRSGKLVNPVCEEGVPPYDSNRGIGASMCRILQHIYAVDEPH